MPQTSKHRNVWGKFSLTMKIHLEDKNYIDIRFAYCIFDKYI